jgi:hypothetical protein
MVLFVTEMSAGSLSSLFKGRNRHITLIHSAVIYQSSTQSRPRLDSLELLASANRSYVNKPMFEPRDLVILSIVVARLNACRRS